jgi:hypothetical protein
MSLVLLIITLLVAASVSVAVACAFSRPLNNILNRLIVDDISIGWLIYLKFAIIVVGISSGVRIREIEKYAAPVRGDREPRVLAPQLKPCKALRGCCWCFLFLPWSLMSSFGLLN